MLILLSAQSTGAPPAGMPSFETLIKVYGPYLGLVLFLVLFIIILQYYWFNRVLKAKQDEINRLVAHEKELNKRIEAFIDKKIGFKKK